MKLFKKRRKLNNKGLSLVELVCAVAIFGLATTAIGGAMVVSAQNYSRGTYELDVQQEAQTTTNLIGDLLFDATAAKFDNTVASPILTIEGEKIKYEITFDKTAATLNYKETVTDGSTAIGVLAENVKDFSANLDKDGNNFKANKNVEVTLEIEKNGRTYEAEYSTTARNGVAESTGVAETAEIIIESPIVLEPGQTYTLPYEVVGSITDKTISLSAESGLSVSQSGSTITVYADTSATGSKIFTVMTNEMQKDVNGNPITGTHLASKDVEVKIRRVNDVTSPQDANDDEIADSSALIGGTSYKNGASYQINFAFVGENLDKVYGKAYDTNYVNPRQLDITWTMTGMEAGFNKEDYVSGVQVVGIDNPSIKFNLIKDMPNNSEIIVTATAKHPAGTNKDSVPYGTVQDIVRIKYDASPYGPSVFVRGSDGVFVLDNTMISQITEQVATSLGSTSSVFQNRLAHLMTIYEVQADGSKVAVPELTDLVIGTDMNLKVDATHSTRLNPEKAYVYKLELMFYNDDARTSPVWTESPYFSEYYPLDAVSVVYEPQLTVGSNNGTEGKGYDMTVNTGCTVNMDVLGMNMQHNQNTIKFIVEKKYDGFTDYVVVDECTDMMVTASQQNSGKITYNFKFTSTGTYRVKAYMTGYTYYSYDGSTTHTVNDLPLFDESDNSGIFYIDVN